MTLGFNEEPGRGIRGNVLLYRIKGYTTGVADNEHPA